jgi:hypothetical protein
VMSSIPDLLTKNTHEFARLMEEVLAKTGETIRSIILINAEIDAAHYKIDRDKVDIERKESTSQDIPIQGTSDIKVERKTPKLGYDPLQALKNVTGTAVVAKTGAEGIQQGKDNQAKSGLMVYLRDNLEHGIPVNLKDGSIITSKEVGDGIVRIEVDRDGEKTSLGKVNETGQVAIDPAYTNEHLQLIQELIESKELEKSTQQSPIEVADSKAQVTKEDLNNLQAYLYSDEYKRSHLGASQEAANAKMQPHQHKYMEQARKQHGSQLTPTDPFLKTQKYSSDLEPEDIKKIPIANEWAAQQEAKRQLQQHRTNRMSR